MRGITVHDELDYLTEFEHVTLALCCWPRALSANRNAGSGACVADPASGNRGSPRAHGQRHRDSGLQALAHLAEDDIPRR
ncbi:MAG: hypothetical protein R2856_29605 [Caldilineaceae bacterium]